MVRSLSLADDGSIIDRDVLIRYVEISHHEHRIVSNYGYHRTIAIAPPRLRLGGLVILESPCWTMTPILRMVLSTGADTTCQANNATLDSSILDNILLGMLFDTLNDSVLIDDKG